MAKEKSIAGGSYLQELLHVGIYKRSQGKVARQVTFSAVLIVVVLAALRLRDSWPESCVGPLYEYFLPGLLLVVGIWAGFRLVNWARFADFLIAVDAEMNKVSWPSRVELIRSSIVVVFVIFFMAALLFSFDIIWQTLFSWLRSWK